MAKATPPAARQRRGTLEVLDLVGLCHSGACRGQGQLLGPSNPPWNYMGFKWRPSLCTWHPREVEKGPCASGRFRRHLDGFRHFTVHMNHNEDMKCIFVYVRPTSDLGAIRISCDLVAISRVSSWLMRVNAKSTRDRYEIKRDTRWRRDLYEASQTDRNALLRFRRAIKSRKPPRWSPGAI